MSQVSKNRSHKSSEKEDGHSEKKKEPSSSSTKEAEVAGLIDTIGSAQTLRTGTFN